MEGDEAMTTLTLVPPLPEEPPENPAAELARNLVRADPHVAFLLSVALAEALEAS